MDFRQFRSQVVEVPVVFNDGDQEITFTVGYRPREIVEEDLELLAQLQSARLADVNVTPSPPPNRAARRAASRSGTQAGVQGTAERPAPGLIEHLKRLVATWSLTWDGEPWPVTEASFRLIEPMMRAVIVAAIVEHYLERPNRMSSSLPSSAGTASGPTGQTSASAPSNGEVVSFPGSTPGSPSPEPARSGAAG